MLLLVASCRLFIDEYHAVAFLSISTETQIFGRCVAALVNCYIINVAAVIVLGLGALFLLFVPLLPRVRIEPFMSDRT